MKSKRGLLSLLSVVAGVPIAAACAQSSAQTNAPNNAHQSRARPALALAGRRPVVVRGRDFTPHVKVRVLVTASVTVGRNVVPNGGGTFTATFATMIDRCTGWRVRAIQTGHAPVVIGGAQPECAPAGSP
jgi:hypothetical protein